MKRKMEIRRWSSGIILLLLVLLAGLAPQASAQGEAPTLSRMAVQLWPDFDDPSLLVLITAELPASVPLPQLVTLPLPPEARINAVARIDPSGAMFDDLTYDVAGGNITVTTTERSFRIEYYAPYEETGDQHSIRYEAPTALAVDSFELRVQQPAAALEMEVEPAGSELLTDAAGLRYYTFAPRPLTSADPFVVTASYLLPDNALTVDQMTPPTEAQPAVPAPVVGGQDAAEEGRNWTLIAIAAVGLTVSAIFLGLGLRDMRRSRTRPEKPRPRRAPAERRRAAQAPSAPAAPSNRDAASAPRFCHNCGTARASEDDRFCRSCGSALKGS